MPVPPPPTPWAAHADAIIAGASALVGAVIGGTASLVTTLLTNNAAHERERTLQAQRDARIDSGVRRSVLVIVRALPEAFRPVYVRGSIAFAAWEHYNGLLRERLARDDVAVAFNDEAHLLLSSLQIESDWTLHFILSAQERGEIDPLPPQTSYDIIVTWLEDLVSVLSRALTALGDEKLSAEVSRRQENGMRHAQLRQDRGIADLAVGLRELNDEDENNSN